MPVRDDSISQKVQEALKPRKSSKTVHQQVSQASVSAGQSAIRTINQSGNGALDGVKSYIQRTAETRDIAVEEASDAIAFLHDPNQFKADVMRRASEKIAASQTIDVDLNPYEGVDFGYTAILPATVMGALPAC